MLQEKIGLPSEVSEFSVRDLKSLPTRLDDEQVNALEKFSASALPAVTPCPDNSFGKAMAVLDANLPRGAVDETAGKIRYEAYRRKLGHFPREAIGILVSKALDRCKWFPTIAECLEILKDWESEARMARSKSAVMLRNENQARLDDTRCSLKRGTFDQVSIDALPDRWKRILECENHLRRHDDGSYTARKAWLAPLEGGS